MKSELLSYIGEPLNELNKEIKMQDQRVVVLFSYMFNECISISNQIAEYNDKIENISYSLSYINDHISKMEFRLGKVDKKINNISNIITNNKPIKNIDEEDERKPSRIKRIWIYIKTKTKRLYKLIYRFIFKKRIQKQEELKKQKAIEEEAKRLQEQKEKIKKILKT